MTAIRADAKTLEEANNHHNQLPPHHNTAEPLYDTPVFDGMVSPTYHTVMPSSATVNPPVPPRSHTRPRSTPVPNQDLELPSEYA